MRFVTARSTCGRIVLGVVLTVAAAAAPATVRAQLNGQNIKGDTGLKSGSQAAPGTYIVLPAYFYSADSLKDRNGTEILRGSLDTTIAGLAVNVVTTKTLAGANYGFLVVLPFANNRLQGTEIDLNPGSGITDMYVQPLSLGWHLKRADVTAGYGIFVPTGRYENGARNNTGLGMWGHELVAGTTVYLNESRAWHAATTATLDFFSKKKDSETKVGNILNLEGGLGRDFLKGAASAGLAYYGTFKVTDDQLPGLPGVLIRGRNRVWGLGPEATLPLATKKTVYGFFTFRYQWELGARTTSEGGAFNLMATFLLKPMKVQP
jgi:hypothetical protein